MNAANSAGTAPAATAWRFAGFTLDLASQSLKRGAEVVRLRPQTLRVLEYLVQHANRAVSKEELFEAVWSDVVVTDDSLVQCVKELRQALGDEQAQLIRTLPRVSTMFRTIRCFWTSA